MTRKAVIMNSSNSSSTDFLITREQYIHYKNVIYLICLPVISLIGVSGNSLSLYVLQKYPTRHAFAIYLKSLTSVDTILLCFASLRSLFKLFIHIDIQYSLVIDTYASFYLGLIVGGLLQRLSSTFITIISIERLLAMFSPFRIRTMIIETRPSRVMVALFSVHLLLQLPTFVFVEVKEMAIAGNKTMFIVARTNLAEQEPILTSSYLFSIAFIGVALPLCVVLTSTVCLVVRINMYENTDIAKFKVSRGSFETEKMTLTLIGMATIFTIMSVPVVCIYVWSAIDQSEENTYLRQLFTDINVLLISMNSASDFIIYCMTSKAFRVLFFDCFISPCKSIAAPQSVQENSCSINVIDTTSRESVDSELTLETFASN